MLFALSDQVKTLRAGKTSCRRAENAYELRKSGLRPVFHHREDRIRAHVQLCALALLLIRVVENTTGDTWRNVRHELDRMHLVTLQTAQGRVAQRTTLTAGQKTILKALALDEPRRFYDFTTPTT